MAFDDHFRLSVHAVITNLENEVLQLKATYGDKHWGLPGGALEPQETIHQALLRECHEELGQEIVVDYMSGMYYHSHYNSHALIFRCHLIANPKDSTEVITLSSEHSEYRYFKLDELSKVQRQRVEECINFDGRVKSAAF